VTTHEQTRAEELDAYLAARQTGQEAARPASMTADEAAFLDGLLALGESTRPHPAFTRELERLLRASAPKREAAMRGRPFFYVIGAAALVAALLAGFIALNPLGVLGELQSAAQAPAVAPRPTIAGAETPSPAATDEPVIEAPSVTPPAWPEESPPLPSLATMLGGGFGGGGEGAVPPRVSFILDASLPEEPEQAEVYAQTPEWLTIPYVEAMASRWGLDGDIYAPDWMFDLQDVEAFVPLSYFVIDGPRELSFYGTEALTYWDRSAFRDSSSGHWYPWGSPPPQEQGIATAEQFLRERDLLQEPYQIETGSYDSNGQVRFYRILDSGQTLYGPFANVTISLDGRVASVSYHTFNLGSLGSYPIISAQEAWEILSAGEPLGRLWYHVPSSPAGDPRIANPRFWRREYEAGERMDVVGSITVWQSATGGPPYASINDLILSGDTLQTLVDEYEALRASSLDTEAPMHVWGQTQAVGGYLGLQVEGWESLTFDSQQGWMSPSGLPYNWMGTIQREGDGGALLTSELMVIGGGETLQMPDLPSDLADGTFVYVQGIAGGDTLEWQVIQERAADEGVMPPPPPAAIQAVVEQVDLIYYASPLERMAQEGLYADFGLRSVQPVWRFNGHTDQGAPFEVYVQAVSDASLLGE
jgi:hypothetical protein